MDEHTHASRPGESAQILDEAHAHSTRLAARANASERLGVDPALTAVSLAAEGLCELTAPEDADLRLSVRDFGRAALAALAEHTDGRTLGALRASTAEAHTLASQGGSSAARALTITYTDDQGEHTVHLHTQPTGALEVDGTAIDHPHAHAEVEAALAMLVRALRHLPAGTWHVDP